MADISLLNTTAQLSGRTVITEEGDWTITGNHTFDRDPAAPFTVTSGSAVVTNLDADKLDGNEASAFAILADNETISGNWVTTGTFTLGDGTAADFQINFNGNAQDYYIALDDSADDLVIGLGTTVGTTPAIGVDENQDVRLWQDLQVDGPSVTIGDGTAEDTQLNFNGNAQDYYLGIDDGTDSLIIGRGLVMGTTPAITIGTDEVVTFAKTPTGLPEVLDVNTTQVGTDADTAEKTLASKALDAGELGTDKDHLVIEAWGTWAATATVKTVRVKFGSTTMLAPSGTINDGDWRIVAEVYRTGATTQKAWAVMTSAATSGTPTPSVVGDSAPTETLSGSITVAVTGQNGTANANDIVLEGFRVVKYPAP